VVTGSPDAEAWAAAGGGPVGADDSGAGVGGLHGVDRICRYAGSTNGTAGRYRRRLAIRVRRLFELHEAKYGSPRITADLRDAGWRVSENTVAALMHEQRLGGQAQEASAFHHAAGHGPLAGPGPGEAGLPRPADQPQVVRGWDRNSHR
jgi:hypothetical protein